MPGNELGDRVHNFFMPDNFAQGQHQPHVLEGNWTMPNSNIWISGQRQVDALNSSSSNYTSQTTDIGRRQAGYPVSAANGLNFSQLDPGPDFYKNQSLNDLPYSNGFMHGDQIYQTRQNDSDFLAVNTNSDNHHLMNSRGLRIHEAHQSKASGRSETSLPSAGFDLFGGQQQISNQQANFMQAIQHQQPGHNDMQILQQQLMIRKMQELQREQQLQQLDLRAQDQINQASPFTVNASGSQSPLVPAAPNHDTLQFPRTEHGTKWMSHGSSGMQVSSRGLFLPQNIGQSQHQMDLVPQQSDQSLYGVPVSSSRGLASKKYSHIELNGSSMLPIPTSGNSLQGTQHKFLPGQNGAWEGTGISSKKLQTGHMFVNSSNQLLNAGVKDMEGLEQVNSMQRNAPQQAVVGPQGLETQSESLQERNSRQVASSNEVTLDPTEEKILFGSDDNIWDVLGKNPEMSGEVGSLFDNVGASNGLPSLQSGSWSALMQSAVAETSSSDIGPQEEWSGVIFHNSDNFSANQVPSMQNNNVKQASLPNDNLHIPSAFGTASMPPSADSNTLNVMVLNQLGHKFQSTPVQRVPTDMSQRFGQPLEEANKQSNVVLPPKPVAEGSQMHGNASQHSFNADINGKTISATWNSRQRGTREQPNDLNVLAAPPPGGDSVSSIHEYEKSQKSLNNQFGTIQGELAHGSSLWKNSGLSSNEFGYVKAVAGNQEATKGVLLSNDAASSVENSFNVGVGHETRPFVQNNFFLNQWKDVHLSTKSQGGERSARMLDKLNEHNQILFTSSSCDKDGVTGHDVETRPKKENSNDSHCSNLSQHAPGGFRESRLSEASDSRSLALGKQKSTNQLPTKAPVSRKFQYHPMGNLDEDEDEEPTNGLKQPQGGIQKVNKGSGNEPSSGCYGPRASLPFSRSVDSSTSSKAPLQSRDMLELLHKVDQSRDRGAMMHLTSEGILPSQPLATDNIDGSAGGHLQRGQSSVSQGFGLQLGPPSQRLQTSDLSSSSNSHGMIDSMPSSHVGAEMAGKGLLRIPSSSLHSLPFSVGESQTESKNDGSAGRGHHGNENSLYKMPRNYLPFSSDAPCASNQLGNEQIKSVKTVLVPQLASSLSVSSSQLMQRGSAETVLPDSSRHLQNDNPASKGMSDAQDRGSAATSSTMEQMHSSQHFGNPAISQPGASSLVFRNMWSKDHGPEQAAQYAKSLSHFSELSQSNIIESSSQGDLDVSKGGNVSSNLSAIHANSADGGEKQHRLKESSMQMESSTNVDLDSKMKESQGNLSSIPSHLDDSPADSASIQKDIQTFGGRFLKPNDFSNEQYALLNQMSILPDAESDPSIRMAKRMKGSNNNLNGQVNLMSGQKSESGDGNSLGLNSGVPSDKFGAPSFPIVSDSLQRNTSSLGNAASQGIVAPNPDASQNHPPNCTTSVRVENQQVSPQMAPSWFNHYGTFKNGQMLPVYNAQNGPHFALRQEESPHGKSSTVLSNINSSEKSTPDDACQVGRTLVNSASTSVVNEHLSSPQPFQVNLTAQDQAILRPNKRKTATSQLHPWHKEPSNGSQILSTLSVAEADWSKPLNHVPEKLGDDPQLIEDGHPLFRSKRRLILTTQLMQQLFCPPPASILSGDASSEFESVTYAVSRLALGDACSSVSFSRESGLLPDGVNLHPAAGKLKGDPRFTQAVEELHGKARKLENDFLRLDKRASILDLRVECLDMEKFSIINRFAKFHGRGQNDNADTASTNAAATTEKPCAQRYVTALPMPRNTPDMAQCLSL